MLKFTIKRLLIVIPVLLGVIIIVFTLNTIMPGDPVKSQLDVNYTQEEYDAMAIKMGLDKPYIIRLGTYIWGIITRFDLGNSYATRRPVMDEISARMWTTIRLGTLSCIVTVLLSLPLGVLSAVKQYSAVDYIVTAASVLLAAVPGFVLSLVGMLIFSLQLKWLPASGLGSWKHYILPVVCSAMMPMAATARMTRSSMLEVIRQDYIRTARSKGLREWLIVWKHALKNALIPVLTMIGTQFGMILGGSVVIESIFSIPGMGTLMVSSINSRDYPMILAITLIISFFMAIIMLIVDLVYAVVDPRIKVQFSGGARVKRKTSHKKAGAGL